VIRSLTSVRGRPATIGSFVAVVALLGVWAGSSSASSSAPLKAPAPTSAAAGKVVFKASCGGCHTLADAKTHGTVGPNLDKLKPSMKLVVKQVTNGGRIMPAFGGRLSKVKIQAVAKYVSSIAGKGKSTTSPGGLP
jgi:mono/diheme cytochrome c family protein